MFFVIALYDVYLQCFFFFIPNLWDVDEIDLSLILGRKSAYGASAKYEGGSDSTY